MNQTFKIWTRSVWTSNGSAFGIVQFSDVRFSAFHCTYFWRGGADFWNFIEILFSVLDIQWRSKITAIPDFRLVRISNRLLLSGFQTLYVFQMTEHRNLDFKGLNSIEMHLDFKRWFLSEIRNPNFGAFRISAFYCIFFKIHTVNVQNPNLSSIHTLRSLQVSIIQFLDT